MPIILKNKNESTINIQDNKVDIIDDRNKSSVTAISKNGDRVTDDKLKLFINGERVVLNDILRKKLIELLMEV
jgi:hypothetical protein